jgi:putative SOS response-associated peptidase YedK
MPVILTTPEEVETWMTAPAEVALKLQRPLTDGSLRIHYPANALVSDCRTIGFFSATEVLRSFQKQLQ